MVAALQSLGSVLVSFVLVILSYVVLIAQGVWNCSVIAYHWATPYVVQAIAYIQAHINTSV